MTDDVATTPAAAPQTEELHCPLCDYDLRGLVDPRCPECGYAFEWAELRDPARRLHPYLFEHHPDHNFWSFFRTEFGSWRPRVFWRNLHPMQPSNVRRLRAYWLLSNLPVLFCILFMLGVIATSVHQYAITARASIMTSFASAPPNTRIQGLTLQQYMDLYYPLFPDPTFIQRVLKFAVFDRFVIFGFLYWPIALLALILAIYRISVRRANVKKAHVLRCVVYSADSIFWLAFPMLAIAAWIFYSLSIGAPPLQSDELLSLGTVLIFFMYIAMTWYRLTIAFKRYLRFDHPFWTVAAVHIILLLLAFVIWINATMGRWG